MSVVSPSLFRRGAVLALAASTVFALSACATRDDDPAASASATPGATASEGTGATAAPEPGTDPSATPAPSATPDSDAPTASLPVGKTCDAIVTLDDVYAFNQNSTLLDTPVSKPTGVGAEIVRLGGLQCQIQNNSSGTVINISVAKLTATEIEYQKSLAFTSSNPVTTYSPAADEGYFTMGATEGEAQVFTGTYWVALSSSEFTEPGAVEPLASSTLGHLRG